MKFTFGIIVTLALFLSVHSLDVTSSVPLDNENGNFIIDEKDGHVPNFDDEGNFDIDEKESHIPNFDDEGYFDVNEEESTLATNIKQLVPTATPSVSPSCYRRITSNSVSYNETTISIICMCGRSGRGCSYIVKSPYKQCVETCLKTGHGGPCSSKYGSFSTCCRSCSGFVTRVPISPLYNLTRTYRWTGCAAPLPMATPSTSPLPPSMTPTPSTTPSCVKSSRVNTISYNETIISAYCMCGRRGYGRSFAVVPLYKICVTDCMKRMDGDKCGSTYSDLSSCCTACSGVVSRVPVSSVHDPRRTYRWTGCVVPLLTPTPSASPLPPSMTPSPSATPSCAKITRINSRSYNETIISAYCMCGRRGSGRSYAVSSTYKECVSKCMESMNGDPCEYTTTYFSACCINCSGAISRVPVSPLSDTKRTYKWTGCAAPLPTPTPSTSALPPSMTPSPSVTPSCFRKISKNIASYNETVLSVTCMCGRRGRGCGYIVKSPYEQCVEKCLMTGDSGPCSSKYGSFSTCCRSCSGFVTRVPVSPLYNLTRTYKWTGCAAPLLAISS